MKIRSTGVEGTSQFGLQPSRRAKKRKTLVHLAESAFHDCSDFAILPQTTYFHRLFGEVRTMPGRAARIIITERQQEVLQTMTRSSTCGRPVTHWTSPRIGRRGHPTRHRGIDFRPTCRAFFKIQLNSSRTAAVIGSMHSPLTRRRSKNRCRSFVPATWRRPVSGRRKAHTRLVSMR
jgi:hypothetical protein